MLKESSVEKRYIEKLSASRKNKEVDEVTPIKLVDREGNARSLLPLRSFVVTVSSDEQVTLHSPFVLRNLQEKTTYNCNIF